MHIERVCNNGPQNLPEAIVYRIDDLCLFLLEVHISPLILTLWDGWGGGDGVNLIFS